MEALLAEEEAERAAKKGGKGGSKKGAAKVCGAERGAFRGPEGPPLLRSAVGRMLPKSALRPPPCTCIAPERMSAPHFCAAAGAVRLKDGPAHTTHPPFA